MIESIEILEIVKRDTVNIQGKINGKSYREINHCVPFWSEPLIYDRYNCTHVHGFLVFWTRE